ncbi:uncharacterized protein LOC135820899 [Sycon ciliatum]|uniref:uncharacterized protein LOC135820899 n=1 Tax=Sycon ciliatum TaxID=27933 RepID=UPI0031F7035B
MKPCWSLVLLVLAASWRIASSSNVVLAPIVAGKPCAALVIIQGAQVPAERYVPLMEAIQRASSSLSLWTGAPDFELNTPEPLVVGSGIHNILDAMAAKGMNQSQCAIFVGGHSLGGALVQTWVVDQAQTPQQTTQELTNSEATLVAGIPLRGQVLLGAFLLRKWRNTTGEGWQYPVSTLTVGGELDGLSRITRLAESYWHQVLHPYPGAGPDRFPLVVLPGVTHFQFASGAPPYTVRERDFKPEVTLEAAQGMIASVVASYLTSHTPVAAQANIATTARQLEDMVKETGDLVEPLITALEMEGFYHFKQPCYDNPVSAACTQGNEWSQRAQMIMSGLPSTTPIAVKVVDSFHPVYQINPIHLPHITGGNCSSPSEPACRLNITTVTQNIYTLIDDLDTAFLPVAATTMRVKMKSRQAIFEAVGITPADFNTTDGGMVCKQINEAAFAWARGHAANSTLARYDKLGQPMIFGDDLGPYNAGPLWIWNDMHYSSEEPGPALLVQSPMMKTPNNYWEPTARGFHYCKLLSPARAMEWIYVDGLRAHDSLANQTIF